MQLFLDKELVFEKLGYEARMSEDPNMWPQQIVDELFHQAPFTSDYSPRVVLRQVDADRRYALGQVELVNQLAINPRDDETPEGLRGQQKIVVPVVIKDGKLLPLDIMLNQGEAEPLTDERLRRAMFRPTLFDAIRERPGDLSLIEQLYPPHRQYGGARGPMVADQGMMGGEKTGSATLLDAILPTIRKSDVQSISEKLAADHTLRTALLGNEAVAPFIQKLAMLEQAPERTAPDYLQSVCENIRPTVLQLSKVGQAYRLKYANPEMLAPGAVEMDRPQAVDAVGQDLVHKTESDGTTTITTTTAVKDTLTDSVARTVTDFGLYKVQALGSNKELVGWVFPKVVDLDGTVLPLAVFTNGAASGVQETIAGTPVDRSTDIITAAPHGFGCFYYTSPSGAVALVPGTVKSEIETPQGKGYQFETMLGDRVFCLKIPYLKQLQQLEPQKVGLPEDLRWFPLDNPIELVGTPEDITKLSAAQDIFNQVRVVGDGLTFSFYGPGLQKVAEVMPLRDISLDEAVFLGACLGKEPQGFRQKLAHIERTGNGLDITVSIPTTARETYALAKTKVAAQLQKLPDLRADLLKEAAALTDPSSVDQILSIGFINPENIMIFAGYAPEFEHTIKKLAELLVASRLGLGSVDEGALQKSLVHLDKVVAGLKTLTLAPQA